MLESDAETRERPVSASADVCLCIEIISIKKKPLNLRYLKNQTMKIKQEIVLLLINRK